MELNNDLIRRYIRTTFTQLLFEIQEPKFFIKYSSKKKVFILYKRFFGFDQYDNKNEQIIAVQDLSTDVVESEKMAKEITGKDLQAKLPNENKPINRGELIMPVSTYKGKKLKEIPLDYLIKFIFNTKWMNIINKDPYVVNVYKYLTEDLVSQTQEYLKKQVIGTSTPELAKKWNEYKKYNYTPGVERMAFAEIIMPLIKTELLNRMVLFASDGNAIIPN